MPATLSALPGICGLVFACQFVNRLASAGLAIFPSVISQRLKMVSNVSREPANV